MKLREIFTGTLVTLFGKKLELHGPFYMKVADVLCSARIKYVMYSLHFFFIFMIARAHQLFTIIFHRSGTCAELTSTPQAHAPHGIQFFHFRTCFRQKLPVSEVSAPPPQQLSAHPTGNPGSATEKVLTWCSSNNMVTFCWY